MHNLSCCNLACSVTSTRIRHHSRRRVPEGDESVREVRISCPDATGLGCDIARMLLDFGLRILTGDLSTDGTWCYLVFVVRPPP